MSELSSSVVANKQLRKTIIIIVIITSDLKSHKQCVQAAKKAQSVLGMVKRHFEVIDREDFSVLYKTYIRPHLEYCVELVLLHLTQNNDIPEITTETSVAESARST